LLTDFGLRDSYAAEMKGVMLTICPNVTIVDISHDVQKFNVSEAAYLLARSARYFPNGTVHVAVVDPEVGGRRKPIILETETAVFIGPDNGILCTAAEEKGVKAAYEIKSKKYLPRHVSPTFHGRDVFARAAAHIAKGVQPRMIGPRLKSYFRPSFAAPSRSADGRINAAVLHVDSFGNIVTNVSDRYLKVSKPRNVTQVAISLPARRMLKMPFKQTYVDVPQGAFVALIGSGGFLEVSQNRGNAAASLGVKPGDAIVLSLES